MQKSRTIFIGDIQGCFDEFKALIKKLNLNKNDKVYIAGDIINRGPKSYKALKYVYKNKDQFTSIIGNHEVNFLKWLNGEGYDSSTKHFKELKAKIKNKPELLDYIKSLPTYIETDDFLFVHGGLTPGKKLDEHTTDDLTRIRYYKGKPWYEYYKGKKTVIYGHWAIDGLRIRQNTIGLDTGCVYGKALTAYTRETGEIIQEQAHNQYIDVFTNIEQGFFSKLIKRIKGK